MNKRQKKKKGLLLIEKVYSNYGKKENKSKEKQVTEEVKVEEAPIEEVVEEVKEEKEEKEEKEDKEVKEEDKQYFLNDMQKTTIQIAFYIITYYC